MPRREILLSLHYIFQGKSASQTFKEQLEKHAQCKSNATTATKCRSEILWNAKKLRMRRLTVVRMQTVHAMPLKIPRKLKLNTGKWAAKL